MAWLIVLQPDLTGRVAFVTGGASGVGLRTFRSLARMGAKVYLADVNQTDGLAAVAELKREGRNVEFFPLDLGTMRSAQQAALAFRQREDRLDILGALIAALRLPVRLQLSEQRGAVRAPRQPSLSDSSNSSSKDFRRSTRCPPTGSSTP